MWVPFADPAAGVSEPPGDFNSNYKLLKQIINKAIRSKVPLEDLHLIPKSHSQKQTHQLSREDLLRLLAIVRRIRTKYQELLESPVPPELERDILLKAAEERLPWEVEALEKVDQWRVAAQTVRAHVQKELNDHLNSEFFR
jgi:hypothetical protein